MNWIKKIIRPLVLFVLPVVVIACICRDEEGHHGEAWREIRDVAFVPVERRSGCTGLKSRIKGG